MQSELSLIYLQTLSDWRCTGEPSLKTLCVNFSSNTVRMDGLTREQSTQWQNHTGKSRESLQWWRGGTGHAWKSDGGAPSSAEGNTQETPRGPPGDHTRPSSSQNSGVVAWSLNRLQTSSIIIQSVLEIASLARSPSFLLHSQSIPGGRLQLICSTSEGRTTLW